VTTIVYKGYEIDAVPYHLADGTWDTKVRIALVHGSQHNMREFTSEERFKTEQKRWRTVFTLGNASWMAGSS
jgi:hypothetical protein